MTRERESSERKVREEKKEKKQNSFSQPLTVTQSPAAGAGVAKCLPFVCEPTGR